MESFYTRTKLSSAYEYWSAHLSCPNCGTGAGPYSGTITFFNDGQKITMASMATRIVRFTAEARVQPTATANSKPYSRLVMRCEACGNENSIFEHPGERTEWVVAGVVDEHRMEEPIGNDTRRITNDSDGIRTRTDLQREHRRQADKCNSDAVRQVKGA